MGARQSRKSIAAMVLMSLGAAAIGAVTMVRTAGIGSDSVEKGRAEYETFLFNRGVTVRRVEEKLLQVGLADCGIAVFEQGLRMVGYVDPPSREDIAELLEASFWGVSLTAMERGFEQMAVRVVRVEKDDGDGAVSRGLVALMSYGHFVLVQKVGGDIIEAFDPLVGVTAWPKEVFLESWTGKGLRLQDGGVAFYGCSSEGGLGSGCTSTAFT